MEGRAQTAAQTVNLKRGDKRFDIILSQTTVQNLHKIFKVDPVDVWLQDDCDGSIFFPDSAGNFNLQDLGVDFQYVTLKVEGHDVTATPSSGPLRQTPTVSSTPTNSGLPAPVFRSVLTKKKTSFTLKVVKASLEWMGKGKPEFHRFGATEVFIDLTEETANVEYIVGVIKQRLGEDYTMVTKDAMAIENSSATQGICFWKNPRRMLFAVPAKELGKRQRDFYESDEDCLSDQPGVKKSKILEELTEVKQTLSSITTLTKDTKMPLGLKRLLHDTFKCAICNVVPLQPPVIVMKCCRSILGCESCVNTWFSGNDALTKTCPKCRGERGYNETMVLRGLDDFLDQCKRCIGTSEAE